MREILSLAGKTHRVSWFTRFFDNSSHFGITKQEESSLRMDELYMLPIIFAYFRLISPIALQQYAILPYLFSLLSAFSKL